MTVELYGYNISVYSWVVRFALHEKNVKYRWVEVNPFAPDVDPGYLEKHPFCRVPALVQGSFDLYETGAITRYIDEAFAGPVLQPADAGSRARVNQVLSVVDSYTYWPLVRQVFSHDVLRPRLGQPFDPAEVQRGLESSERILIALEKLAENEKHIVGNTLTLADIHLAPMLAYFCESDRGRSKCQSYDKLWNWFAETSKRPAYLDTKPELPISGST